MITGPMSVMDQRCWNWGRWAGGGGLGAPGCCGSAERRYVPPRDDSEVRRERISRIPVDILDAEVVEAAIVNLQDRRSRRFLVLHYVQHAERTFVCQRLRLAVGLFEGQQLLVLLQVQQAVERQRLGLSALSQRFLHPA